MTHYRRLLPLCALALLAFPAPGSAAPITRNLIFKANVNEYPQPEPGSGYSSCWSYIHGNGDEYALIGTVNGTAIYNVTVPDAPYRVAFIPGPFSIWREMKSYRNWVYITTEGTGTGEGLQIVRMTNPEAPVLVNTYTTGFTRSHTVAIDTSRALLVCNGTRDAAGQATGMRFLSLANPEAPAPLGVWPSTYPVPDGQYIHDSAPIGNRLYGSSIYSGLAMVFDITNPASPVVQQQWTYPGAFTHNSWPTADGNTLYATDETNGEPLKIFDISNLASPVLVNGITSNPDAIVHNAHVWNNELFLANYTEGIRILDISDPHHPAEFASADSYFGTSGGFSGVWEVCANFPSGIVIASDRQTGLYVYQPVRDYGILRVRVLNDQGGPMAGVTVKLTTQGDSLSTPADGIVQFAPSPGSHTVLAREFGWYDASATRLVSDGLADTLELTLQPRPVVDFSGVVTDASSQNPLFDAEVSIAPAPLAAAHSDVSGFYSLGGVPTDTYELSVRRPGYMPIESIIELEPAFPGQSFQLVPAPFYDNLESGVGWIAGAPGDNATSGLWTRVEPFGTGEPNLTSGGARGGLMSMLPGNRPGPTSHPGDEEQEIPGDYQPEHDRTPAPGTMCFVTGQGNTTNPDQADVDNGKTSLTTPMLNATGMAEPTIGYWMWFFSSGAQDDWFAVQISNDNGASWAPVDTIYGPSHERWHEHSIRIADHVTPTSQMRVRFVCADFAPTSVVEGAIDDVTVYDAANAVVGAPGGAAPAALRFETPRPNPSRGPVTIDLAVPAAGALDVGIFDVHGRRVRALERATVAPGRRTFRWDGRDDRGGAVPAGLYFARAQSGGVRAEARIVRTP